MHITITGVHLEITEAIRAYTLEKLEPLSRYIPADDSSAKLSVEYSKTTEHHVHGNVFQAEAQLHFRGKSVNLKTTQDDLYKAIDTLKDMLTRELASHKDKERSVLRRSAHKVKLILKRLID